MSGLRCARSAAPFGEGMEGSPFPPGGFGMWVGAMFEQQANDIGPCHEGGNMQGGPVLSRRDRQVWVRAVLEQGRNRRGRTVGANGCVQDSP